MPRPRQSGGDLGFSGTQARVGLRLSRFEAVGKANNESTTSNDEFTDEDFRSPAPPPAPPPTSPSHRLPEIDQNEPNTASALTGSTPRCVSPRWENISLKDYYDDDVDCGEKEVDANTGSGATDPDEAEPEVDEWHEVARVLDRTFFWILFALMSASGGAILLYPKYSGFDDSWG